MKKANLNNGIVFSGELESLIDRGRGYRWFQFAGASYPISVNEIVALLQEHILPIFADFEDFTANIEKILSQYSQYFELFYYIYFFLGKEKAQQYFNQFINQNKAEKRLKGFYHSLEKLPKESIDVNLCEFVGVNIIKFAFLNGIELND